MTEFPTQAASTGGPAGQGGQRDLAPGDWVGPYQVVQELGRGGMGVVLRVRHSQTGHEAALKLILGTVASDQALARFGREAEALAKVQHRNVIRVFELGRAAQGPYLVTELLEGVPLDELVRPGPLEADEAVGIVLQLCDALTAVHGAGILHRDLKPENAIRRPDGSIVLLDFGVAQDESAEKLTQTGQLVGTPSYMSPEQAAGEHASVGVRSDVYGLGAILFTLLNGEPPFHGEASKGQFTLIWAVLKGNPPWPREHELPHELVKLTRRAMSLAPSARPESAAAFKSLLAAYLAEGSRARQRRPIRLIVAGAALTLLVVAATAFALTRGVAGASPTPTRALGQPADLDERIAALGVFGDPGFREALAQLAAEPAYTRYLKGLRAAAQEYRELEAGVDLAYQRGVVPRELILSLRAFSARWEDRPETPGLLRDLSVLTLAAEPDEFHVLPRQTARVYGVVPLDPSGQRVLAIGYRDNPSMDWRPKPKVDTPYPAELTDAASGARIVAYGDRPEPLVAVDLVAGSEEVVLSGLPVGKPYLPANATLPLPLRPTLPSPTGYVAGPEGAAWVAFEQVLPLESPDDPAARVELWLPGAKAPAKTLAVPGLPAQSYTDLARGVGQPRVLALRGNLLGVGMGDGRVVLLNHVTEEVVWQAQEHTQRVMAIEILEDGRLLTASGRSLQGWAGHPTKEHEDMRVVLWSPAGKLLRTYTRAFGGRGGRMSLPKFLRLAGKRVVCGVDTNRVVCVFDPDAPDDSPGEVHRLLPGKRIEGSAVDRHGIGSHRDNWGPEGPEPVGALWLSPTRVLVWGDFEFTTELRVFEVPADAKAPPRQLLGWTLPHRVAEAWLTPDGKHVLFSARSRIQSRHRIERRRLVP